MSQHYAGNEFSEVDNQGLKTIATVHPENVYPSEKVLPELKKVKGTSGSPYSGTGPMYENMPHYCPSHLFEAKHFNYPQRALVDSLKKRLLQCIGEISTSVNNATGDGGCNISSPKEAINHGNHDVINTRTNHPNTKNVFKRSRNGVPYMLKRAAEKLKHTGTDNSGVHNTWPDTLHIPLPGKKK